MAKKLTLKELGNLSRLLISSEESNVEIGLEILYTHPKNIGTFYRELVLLYFFHDNMELKTKAELFIKAHYGDRKIPELDDGFKIFRRINYHYIYNQEVRKLVIAHENIRAQFQEMILQNKNYSLRYLPIAKKLHCTYKEHLDLAETYYRMVLETNFNNEDSLFHLAFLLEAQGEVDEALELYLKVIALNPKESSAFNNIGLIYDNKGNLEEAYAYYTKAIALNPNTKIYLRNKARVCARMDATERKKEAKIILKDLIKASPEDGMVWNSWADYLWNVEGKHKEAEAAYLQGLKAEPNNAYLLGNLGELYIDEYKEIDKGLKYYTRALEEKTAAYRLITMITVLVLQKEDWATAKKYYQKLVKEYLPKPIAKAAYLREDQWAAFLEAEKLLKAKLKKKK